jgi:hypothetical protein
MPINSEEYRYEWSNGMYLFCVPAETSPTSFPSTSGLKLAAPIHSVAMCFHKLTGVLFAHGGREQVDAWHKKTIERLASDIGDEGRHESIASLIVVEGRFPLDEINKCVSTRGYCRLFYEKLRAGFIEEASVPFSSSVDPDASPAPKG